MSSSSGLACLFNTKIKQTHEGELASVCSAVLYYSNRRGHIVNKLLCGWMRRLVIAQHCQQGTLTSGIDPSHTKFNIRLVLSSALHYIVSILSQ